MRSVVLFSGGFDCIAAVIKYMESKPAFKPDLLFFDYNQIYLENELEAAQDFTLKHDFRLIVHKMPKLKHDQERRNFYFLAEAKLLGFDHIITGNRNVHSWFDKYKDSNYFSIKQFAKLMNIKVQIPVLAWSKSKIIKYINNFDPSLKPYNCYHNNTDYKSCGCPNCAEMRRILD